MKRRVSYFTGTRADFGLLESTLARINSDDRLELSVIVTGMHLHDEYGHTADEITAAGLPISATVPVPDSSATSGGQMARNLGHMLQGFVDALETIRPDIAVVLGDRGEMLAAAIAAAHLNIPIAHIHGGERSGTIDESIRHAISKFAHIHLVTTAQSAERLIRMGEMSEHVHQVGAPGLDGLEALASVNREDLVQQYGLRPDMPLALVVYHPVVQAAEAAGREVEAILAALGDVDYQVLALLPNSDAGGSLIRDVLAHSAASERLRLVVHLERSRYVSFLKAADIIVGNSSSGIIEAATFGTPVINVGTRQNMRERNANVIDVPADRHAVSAAIHSVRNRRFPASNIYGDGHAGERIVDILASKPLDAKLLAKSNAY